MKTGSRGDFHKSLRKQTFESEMLDFHDSSYQVLLRIALKECFDKKNGAVGSGGAKLPVGGTSFPQNALRSCYRATQMTGLNFLPRLEGIAPR